MPDIFDKIIAREIPANIVFEDEQMIAFLDIRPINKGHTLIVPKKHAENILDMDTEELAQMMRIAQKIARATKDATQADGINILMNNGSAAGQEVFHAHVHVIPRFKNDTIWPTPGHSAYEDNEASTLAASIKNAIH